MHPSNQESERYAELSRHYLARADEYLRAGDRVQASEKGWGAVAEAIKSIAEGRGLEPLGASPAERCDIPTVRGMESPGCALHV